MPRLGEKLSCKCQVLLTTHVKLVAYLNNKKICLCDQNWKEICHVCKNLLDTFCLYLLIFTGEVIYEELVEEIQKIKQIELNATFTARGAISEYGAFSIGTPK